MIFAAKRHCGQEVPASLMYTTHDVSATGSTPSSDDRMSFYCQIRVEKTREHTGNKESILATVTINWQQKGYADNKEGHIGNNNGTLTKRKAYWQQEWYAGNHGILTTKRNLSNSVHRAMSFSRS